MHLRSIEHDEIIIDPADGLDDNGIPAFEGQRVDGCRVKLSGGAGLESDDVNRMDQIIRLVVEARVVAINHVVDEKTGQLHRVHTVKIIEAHQVPYDYDAEASRA